MSGTRLTYLAGQNDLSMSQISITETIARHIARNFNEEFFDEHPNSFNVERFRISNWIVIFLDLEMPETFLLELRFENWKEAQRYGKQIHHILKNSKIDVDLYRSLDKLFLRRLLV
jgi:hypothetical protein